MPKPSLVEIDTSLGAARQIGEQAPLTLSPNSPEKLRASAHHGTVSDGVDGDRIDWRDSRRITGDADHRGHKRVEIVDLAARCLSLVSGSLPPSSSRILAGLYQALHAA